MKFYITAKSSNGRKYYAAYDSVIDSLMLPENTIKKDERVEFDSFNEAEQSISAYQGFQRHLTHFTVEQI